MRPRERGREQSNIGDQALSSQRGSSHGGGELASSPCRLQVRTLNTGAKHVVRKGDIRALLLTF